MVLVNYIIRNCYKLFLVAAVEILNNILYLPAIKGADCIFYLIIHILRCNNNKNYQYAFIATIAGYYNTISGFAGPKCFSITIGSVAEKLTMVTPSLAACSLIKNSSFVNCP